MRRPKRVLERAFILEEVWGYDFPTTANSLEVYVGYVRRKTEADGESRLLHTVRGVGYVCARRLRDIGRARHSSGPPVVSASRMSLAARISLLALSRSDSRSPWPPGGIRDPAVQLHTVWTHAARARATRPATSGIVSEVTLRSIRSSSSAPQTCGSTSLYADGTMIPDQPIDWIGPASRRTRSPWRERPARAVRSARSTRRQRLPGRDGQCRVGRRADVRAVDRADRAHARPDGSRPARSSAAAASSPRG